MGGTPGEAPASAAWRKMDKLSVTFDQPLRRAREERAMMNFGYHSIWGVLILAGDIWAIINIFQSAVSNEKKLIWILVVVLLPLLGLILWYFLGPREGARGR
jgi:hypothetical protein